ncbi:MAG: FIG00659521: hypothetical protein, partial [uncultured Nocardioidaceae bacterium]
ERVGVAGRPWTALRALRGPGRGRRPQGVRGGAGAGAAAVLRCLPAAAGGAGGAVQLDGSLFATRRGHLM